MCLPWLQWRKRRYYHRCLLVGPVILGKPVAPFNRRIICVPANSCSVESGSFDAIRHGRGKIQEVNTLGRVIVPFEKHLSIVEAWVEEALDGSIGGISEQVINKVLERMSAYEKACDGETMELDVFSAVVVNGMEDKVFVYRKPSSFP